PLSQAGRGNIISRRRPGGVHSAANITGSAPAAAGARRGAPFRDHRSSPTTWQDSYDLGAGNDPRLGTEASADAAETIWRAAGRGERRYRRSGQGRRYQRRPGREDLRRISWRRRLAGARWQGPTETGVGDGRGLLWLGAAPRSLRKRHVS